MSEVLVGELAQSNPIRDTVRSGGQSRAVLPRLAGVIRRWKLAVLGGVIGVVVVTAAIGADVLAPHDPLQMRPTQVLAAPSAVHPLGTDQFGRDILSRVIFGARLSIIVGLGATMIGATVGALIGIVSGYLGGWPDLVIQRVMDVMMSIPALLLALALVAALEPSLTNVILAVGFAQIAGANRVVRSQVLSLKQREYVTAARVMSASQLRIVGVHILPNCLAAYVIVASAAVSTAILAEAALGFLGLGVPPPTPTWGSMLATAKDYVNTAPWVPFFPGLAISLTVFAFNMIGDALRDLLDPRMRTGN